MANTDVAVIERPRLPYAEGVEERFGVDRATWKALVEAVFPLAKTPGAVVLALSYCKARKLDPFKRVVHIVPVWDKDRGEVETVWPGIAEHRTTAFRTRQYAGSDPASYGTTVTETFTDKVKTKAGTENKTVKVSFPEWCQLTVYRLVGGQRVPVPGPRVYWREFYSRIGRTVLPNDRWQRSPFQMIEKCAEAAALRRAFPEELGDEFTAEEAEGLFAAPAEATIMHDAPPRPTRAMIEQQMAAEATPTADLGSEELDAAEMARLDREFRQATGGAVYDDEPEPDDQTHIGSPRAMVVQVVSANGEVVGQPATNLDEFCAAFERAAAMRGDGESVDDVWQANSAGYRVFADTASPAQKKRLRDAGGRP